MVPVAFKSGAPTDTAMPRGSNCSPIPDGCKVTWRSVVKREWDSPLVKDLARSCSSQVPNGHTKVRRNSYKQCLPLLIGIANATTKSGRATQTCLFADKASHGPSGSEGQTHWAERYPDCGWQAQSPLNIQTDLVQYDPSLPPIEPEGYRDPGSGSLTLTNNGHTVQLSLPENLHLHGLPSLYSAVQLHFHWGSSSNSQAGGSEHLVDGHAFPAELHVVHFNSEKYANLSVAKHQPDGLAVLGIFLEVDSVVENPAYNHILDRLDSILYAEQEVTVAPFSVRELLPEHLGHYYRYTGSLTTPPCYQSVLWTVFRQPARISAAQLEKLQKSLYSTKHGKTPSKLLVSNFRVPQSLNQRLVLASFPVGPSDYSAGEVIAIIVAVLLGCLGVFLAGWILAKRTR